jgi:hypothetical protein
MLTFVIFFINLHLVFAFISSSLRGSYGNAKQECFNYYNYTCMLNENKSNISMVYSKQNTNEINTTLFCTNDTHQANCTAHQNNSSTIYLVNNNLSHTVINKTSHFHQVRLHFDEYWGLDVIESSIDWKYWTKLIPSYFRANRTEFYV